MVDKAASRPGWRRLSLGATFIRTGLRRLLIFWTFLQDIQRNVGRIEGCFTLKIRQDASRQQDDTDGEPPSADYAS